MTYHLELLLLLRCNFDLWNAATIDEIIKNNAENPEVPNDDENDN
jgi:hypothetical protein